MNWLSYWQLRERPFESTWDTRFFFPGREHREALSRLLYLTQEQTMTAGLLTGEIGSGKTLTASILVEQLPREQFEVVMLENSGFPFRDLLALILGRLSARAPDERSGAMALLEVLRSLLEQFHRDRRHLVIVLDEAQEIAPDEFGAIKSLTNFNGQGRNYLSLVLVGQPELTRHIRNTPALDQRIGLRYHLKGFPDCEIVGDYLRHRLRAAGHSTGDLFEGDTVELMREATGGVPRELNRLAKLALEHAWLQADARVTPATVRVVIRDRKGRGEDEA